MAFAFFFFLSGRGEFKRKTTQTHDNKKQKNQNSFKCRNLKIEAKTVSAFWLDGRLSGCKKITKKNYGQNIF